MEVNLSLKREFKKKIKKLISLLGGLHACPGRVLAKRIMLLCGAMMATMFDIEILANDSDLHFGSPRFGFGVRKPAGLVPFRIRIRQRPE
jgi:hypothetical protein